MKRNNVEVAASLCQKLWNVFTKRVSYAKLYSEMVNRKGGQIVIDHIGFRTFFTHTVEQPEGILAIRHILECL